MDFEDNYGGGSDTRDTARLPEGPGLDLFKALARLGGQMVHCLLGKILWDADPIRRPEDSDLPSFALEIFFITHLGKNISVGLMIQGIPLCPEGAPLKIVHPGGKVRSHLGPSN